MPASLLIVGPDRRARLAAVGILGITGVAAAVQVVMAAVYFGSPLPLPFYAKALSQYGEFFHERFAGFSARMLQEYIGSYWFLMCIGLSAIVPSRQLGRLRTSGVNLGLAVATVVFIAYYATSVLQIMGIFERFYYPTLPAIAFLAAVGAARLARPAKELLQRFRMERRIMALAFYFALVQAIVWMVASLPPGGFRDFSSALSEERLSDLNTPRQYAVFFSRYWYGLDRFSALPDNLVIATTEVGIPGVLNPGKRIVDIAGLNDTRFALTGFSTQSLLREDHPDLIYMPHPGYHDLIAQIRDDAQFQNDYEFFTSDELGGARMEVAIWRGSQYYSSMREIIREGRPAGAAVAGEPHQ